MPINTVAALRGTGRHAFRLGLNVPRALVFTSIIIGRDLDATERHAVMRGWAAERAEVAGV